MQKIQIFYPVIAQVILTFIVLCSLAYNRVTAIKRARVNPQVIADPNRFDEVLKGLENLSDNFENLFEMPVLFFVAAVLIFIFHLTDRFYLFVAWTYVILRYIHSYIHCTNNRVINRFYAFLYSSIVLLIIWARIAFQILNR